MKKQSESISPILFLTYMTLGMSILIYILGNLILPHNGFEGYPLLLHIISWIAINIFLIFLINHWAEKRKARNKDEVIGALIILVPLLICFGAWLLNKSAGYIFFLSAENIALLILSIVVMGEKEN